MFRAPGDEQTYIVGLSANDTVLISKKIYVAMRIKRKVGVRGFTEVFGTGGEALDVVASSLPNELGRTDHQELAKVLARSSEVEHVHRTQIRQDLYM